MKITQIKQETHQYKITFVNNDVIEYFVTAPDMLEALTYAINYLNTHDLKDYIFEHIEKIK